MYLGLSGHLSRCASSQGSQARAHPCPSAPTQPWMCPAVLLPSFLPLMTQVSKPRWLPPPRPRTQRPLPRVIALSPKKYPCFHPCSLVLLFVQRGFFRMWVRWSHNSAQKPQNQIQSLSNSYETLSARPQEHLWSHPLLFHTLPPPVPPRGLDTLPPQGFFQKFYLLYWGHVGL